MGWRLIDSENSQVYAILNDSLSFDNACDVATCITNLTGRLLTIEKKNARGQWAMWG